MTLPELKKKLKAIQALGFVKTHRAGNTGVGKTLEDLLGIKENNIPGLNGKMIELKSARKDAKSMLTLFTKSPLPAKANSVLPEKFGYETEEERGKKSLHTTINAADYNILKESVGFKIGLKSDRIVILDKDK